MATKDNTCDITPNIEDLTLADQAQACSNLPDSEGHSFENTVQKTELRNSDDKGITFNEPQQDNSRSGSDCSETPSAPKEPSVTGSSSNAINLAWNPPKRGLKSVVHYEIKYKESIIKNAKWIAVATESNRCYTTITDLKCATDYEFKIRAIDKEGEEGPFSPAIKTSTKISLAKKIQKDAKKMSNGHPAKFKLPLLQPKASTNSKSKTRKCIFGKRTSGGNEKTVMIVGATGSGKSTLIDGMINYITHVSWDDDFRFTLVDLTEDEKGRESNPANEEIVEKNFAIRCFPSKLVPFAMQFQALSLTEWITCYAVCKMDGGNIDYDLNIIDTPGFGDTRGIVRDKVIVDQIREFFTTPGDQGITCLDAVCFVTQAPLARLTPSQKYIFDSILSIFGQDIASNIFVLMTFADGSVPPVANALKEANVPFKNPFKFNNSALFSSPTNSGEDEFGSLFWKMGRESFRIFFDELQSVDSKSLQLTTEVLLIRKNLEVTIQGLQPQIAEGMNKLNTIREEKDVLKRHKNDIEANRDFEYEVDEIHMRKINLKPRQYVTNCLTCNITCHFPCGIARDEDKSGCAAMSGGKCTVCPGKCHWSMHYNNPYRFETYPVKVKKTSDELKKKYDIAQEGEKKQKSLIGTVKAAFSSLGSNVMKMVNDVRGYINKLNEIALRPNPLSDSDYIDLLIESEKNEKKYGLEQRLKLYNTMRKEAQLVANTVQTNFKPWGENEDIVKDE